MPLKILLQSQENYEKSSATIQHKHQSLQTAHC